ncbi:hypothetical protein Ciccas_006868 [Cichlidogyrus casuarinus]|uniref:ETS domain-containing protein n=1 Tax=Cichlidogyrus casuarinus TaxID=1844966 RepID=A0ABD2Q4H9_9PLAT
MCTEILFLTVAFTYQPTETSNEAFGVDWQELQQQQQQRQRTAEKKCVKEEGHMNPVRSFIQERYRLSSEGPIQLWQFLLDELLSPSSQGVIHWTGQGAEFKLNNPDEVARRWGIRKNKPKMTYEKLSRGLRYYYEKKIIEKAPGKRYVYRFTENLHSLILKTNGQSFKLGQQQAARADSLRYSNHSHYEVSSPHNQAVDRTDIPANYPQSTSLINMSPTAAVDTTLCSADPVFPTYFCGFEDKCLDPSDELIR